MHLTVFSVNNNIHNFNFILKLCIVTIKLFKIIFLSIKQNNLNKCIVNKYYIIIF